MPDPITNPGGHRKLNTNEQVTSDAWNDHGKQINNTIFNLVLARLLQDDAGGTWEDGFFGDDCLAQKGSGSLDVDVAAGWGFFYDSSESDAFDPIYKPIVVRAAFTQTLAAHDPADPRIDIICLAPATDDDESASVFVKSGGSVSTSSLSTRTRWGYEVQVVEGTPASSPSVPSTPAGHVKIAECTIPAGSGDVAVEDTRTELQLTKALASPPATEYHHNWVPGSGTELQVTAGTYPDVSIATGDADIEGRSYSFAADTLTLPTVDGTYYVWAAADGTFGAALTSDYSAYIGGPRLGAEREEVAAILATAVVDTSGGTVTVTDARWRAPYGTEQLEDGAVSEAKVGFTVVRPQVTEGAWGMSGGNSTVNITVQLIDIEGNNLASQTCVLVELVDSSMAELPSGSWSLSVSTGTAISTVSRERLLVETDTTGLAELTAEYLSGPFVGTLYARVRPLEENVGNIGTEAYATLSP